MTDTADRTTTSTDPVDEVKEWLADNWDPDLTVAAWWERLGTSGWGVPTWPSDWFGKDLSRAEGVRVQQAIADFGALPAPGGLGLMLAFELVSDRQRRTRDAAMRDRLVQAAFEKGLLVLGCGPNSIRLMPPWVCSSADADVAVDILESCLTAASGKK